jgi:hypothetical protein
MFLHVDLRKEIYKVDRVSHANGLNKDFNEINEHGPKIIISKICPWQKMKWKKMKMH